MPHTDNRFMDRFPPFPIPSALIEPLLGMQPPGWLVAELHQRVVLFLNHVLQQESQAMERLQRQQGKRVLMQWRQFTVDLRVTPAGLLELAVGPGDRDLTLTIGEESPLALARLASRGQKPQVRVEGDVQLAGEIGWLAEHVRWDVEEDLSRIIGDVPAQMLATAARRVTQVLRGLTQSQATDAQRKPTE